MNDLVKKDDQVSAADNTMNALTTAISSGTLVPDQLDAVISAQERILDRQARQQFAEDMSLCQGAIPSIFKSKENNQTHTKYEDLESLNSALIPVYSKYGFSVSFNSKPAQDENYIGMVAIVKHKGGWNEVHDITLPIDLAGLAGKINKTKIHAVASTRSYARRYLLREIFNITTSEDIDDDATMVVEYISTAQIDFLERLLTESKSDSVKFLKVCKVDRLAEILTIHFDGAVERLQAKIRESKKDQK